MSWFFKTNTNDTGEGEPIWEDVSFSSFINYACGIGLVILSAIAFLAAFPIMPLFTIIIILVCLISCLSYRAVTDGKTITGGKIIQDVFKHYKVSIMSVLSFFIIIDTFKKLGSVPGLFSILTVALIYFGVISISIFNPIVINEKLSKLASYNQADRKKCSVKQNKEEKGFFSFIGMGGGTNIVKELKSIHKKFNVKNNT
jgi:hypothetical protein